MASGIHDLTERLAALRGAVRRLYALNGVSRLLLVAAAAAGTTFLLDWTVYHFLNEELPRGVRLTLLAVSAAAVVWSLGRHLLYPLRRPLTDDDLALCIERQFPALQDRLISAVQLSRSVDDPAWRAFNSPALVNHLLGEAREKAGRLDFRRVLAPRPARRAALLAVSVAVLGAVLVASNPLYASIWFRRLIGGDAKWPRQTTLIVMRPPAYVAKGDDCPVAARAYGRIPDRAVLLYRSAGGETGSARMEGLPVASTTAADDAAGLPRGDYREFKYEFSRVVEAFEFAVRAGDDESAWHRIEVRTAPALEGIVKWYAFPSHLPMTSTPADAPEEGGNVKAPVGTEVRFRAIANEPLAGARLVLGSRPDKREPLAFEADPRRPKRVVTGAFRVQANDEYRLELTGENGLGNREPIRFSVIAVPDAPPAIRVLEPGADRIATADAVWPLQIETTDDFGIQSVRLVWWVIAQGPGPEQAVEFAYPAQNDADVRAVKIGSRYAFDLSKTGAKEREQVAYRFEARDFDASKTRPTQTRTFHFTIWSRSDLEKREEETMNRLKEELRKVQESEEKIRSQAVNLRDRLQGLEALETSHKGELQALALDQRQKVGQRLERVGRDLQESVKTIRYNRLLDQAAIEKLERLRGLVEEAARTKSPETGYAIGETGGARSPAERRSRFDRALERVDGLLADLREALGLLEEWMNYQEVVRRWREVKERQDGVYKAILDLLGAPKK
jgi:hypothetical protein